jgi:hypothetical protein
MPVENFAEVKSDIRSDIAGAQDSYFSDGPPKNFPSHDTPPLYG